MTLDQFRSSEDLTKWWAKVYNHRNFQDFLLPALGEKHPMRFVDIAPVTTSSAEKKLGKIEGYEEALVYLKLATTISIPQAEMPPASFADPISEETE